jgi:hypothetical protein
VSLYFLKFIEYKMTTGFGGSEVLFSLLWIWSKLKELFFKVLELIESVFQGKNSSLTPLMAYCA